MPCEHVVTPYEASLLQACEKSKEAVGFDGLFSLPAEQRVLLEAESQGASTRLMQVIQHLKLDKAQARALFFGLMSQPQPGSVQEVKQFYQDLLHR